MRTVNTFVFKVLSRTYRLPAAALEPVTENCVSPPRLLGLFLQTLLRLLTMLPPVSFLMADLIQSVFEKKIPSAVHFNVAESKKDRFNQLVTMANVRLYNSVSLDRKSVV